MKKVLLSVFAIAALASCMQDDILGTAQGTAISFDNAYVDNATKAIDNSFNNNNLEEFQVYGTVTNTANEVANIFPGIAVVKGGAGVGANWTYDAQYTQYWVANNSYNFTAIVAGNEAGETMVEVDTTTGMPKAINVEDAEAQNDVLFAQVGPVNYANNVQPVKFTFAHLLAKAKVSVKNVMDVNNGNYYVVKDVKITNAHKSATYVIGEGWGSYADAYVLPFGDIVAADATAANAEAIQLPKDGYGASNFERLLIPQQNCAFTISVDYVLYQSGVQIDTKEELTVSTVATIEAGKTYNFALTLGNPGEPITFDVEAVEDWVDGGNIYDVKTAKVTTPEELADAIADENVGAVVLMNDIELSSSITRNGEAAGATIAKEFILDGNGNTLSYNGTNRAIDIVSVVENETYKNVTIKDLTINCTASYCERGINYNANGSLILDNVKVLGTNVTYALNCPGKADGAKVTVKNSELTANIALNVWGENMWINVENSILTSVENNTAEGYAAVSFNNDGATAAVGTVANFYGGKIEARDEKGELACAIRNAALAGVNLNDTEVIGTTRVPCVIAAYEGSHQFYSFDTLQEAINKVQKDKKGTLRLTGDITLEEPVTVAKSDFKVVLDLNGHNISGTSTSTEGVELFVVNGTLDVQGNGIISLTGDNFAWNTSYRYTTINVRETGVVTLGEGVSVVCEASKDGSYGMCYAVDIYTTGKLNINGATLRSNYIAVRCFYGDAVVNVGSGSIIRSTHANNYGIWLQSSPGAVVTIAEDVEYTKSDDGSLYYFN